VTPPPPVMLPVFPPPYPGGDIEGYSSLECFAACDSLFFRFPDVIEICKENCRAVKDYTCESLFRHCGSLAAVNETEGNYCMTLYLRVCHGL
jgi:hypothetical protein